MSNDVHVRVKLSVFLLRVVRGVSSKIIEPFKLDTCQAKESSLVAFQPMFCPHTSTTIRSVSMLFNPMLRQTSEVFLPKFKVSTIFYVTTNNLIIIKD